MSCAKQFRLQPVLVTLCSCFESCLDVTLHLWCCSSPPDGVTAHVDISLGLNQRPHSCWEHWLSETSAFHPDLVACHEASSENSSITFVNFVTHYMQLQRRIVDAALSRCTGIMQGDTQVCSYLTLGVVTVTASLNMHVALHRQHKTGMDAMQGIISSMEETGIRTIRLGATQHFKEAPAAADESVPGGTTRLAMVDEDPAVDAGAPILDVVLSKYQLTHLLACNLGS